MKVSIIKASQLGTNCFSPLRFLNSCHHCSRYRNCNYTERIANEEHDKIVAEMLITYREYKRLSHRLEQVLSSNTLDNS